MKRRKRIMAIISLAVALAACAAMPPAALGKEPPKLVAKKKPAEKTPANKKKEASADNISVGGKTLSQWRALFGESSDSSGTATIFSKSHEVGAPPAKVKPQIIRPSSAGQGERQTVERILGDARKVHWTRLAVIANNMANTDTVGYKRNRTLLEGAISWAAMKPNDWSTQGQLTTAGISAAGGGPVLTIQTDFRQGRLKKTGRMLDIAIEGKGFLQVINQQTGETLYTRAGNLSVNSNGDLTVGPGKKGWLIEPGITIPQDATAISFRADGYVVVKQSGTTKITRAGRIMLAYFNNPEGLRRLGGKLFGGNDAASKLFHANPGEKGCGIIWQGHLEQSNVDLSKELADWKAMVERIKTLEQKLP